MWEFLSLEIIAINLQAKFYSAFKPDFQGNVEFEEGIRLLKILNISSHNVLLTELRGKMIDRASFKEFSDSFYLRLNIWCKICIHKFLWIHWLWFESTSYNKGNF